MLKLLATLLNSCKLAKVVSSELVVLSSSDISHFRGVKFKRS